MPTTLHGYPYPDPTAPVSAGANDIRALAEAVDSKLGAPPSCRVWRTTAFSVPNSAATPIPFDGEVWDTEGIHDPAVNPSRLTCKTAGTYLIVANCGLALAAGGSFRQYRLMVNGSNIALFTCAPSGVHNCDATLTAMFALTVGQYVEFAVFHDAGAALLTAVSTSPTLTIHRLAA
jgi:hypothetical protein